MTEVNPAATSRISASAGSDPSRPIRTTAVRWRSAVPSGSVRRSGYCRRSAGRRRRIGDRRRDDSAGNRRRPRRRGRRRQRAGPQLADDGARLDAAILVAVARAVQLERAHVPGRARHLAGAVARATARQVPEPRLGEMPTPGEEHRGSGGIEVDDELGCAVAGRRTCMFRTTDGGDRPAPDRQPSRHPGIVLGSTDGEAVSREAIGRESSRAAVPAATGTSRTPPPPPEPHKDGDTQPL